MATGNCREGDDVHFFVCDLALESIISEIGAVDHMIVVLGHSLPVPSLSK